jgi:hypothetical protein
MDKELVLQMCKRDMNGIIERITLENINEMKLKMTRYFDFLEKLVELNSDPVEMEKEGAIEENFLSKGNNREQIKEESEAYQPVLATSSLSFESIIHDEKSSETNEEDHLENKIQEEVTTQKMYLVERKLRGAYCPEINAFIPEGVLRRIGISHHDYVYAEKIEDNKYLYSIAKKGPGVDPIDRVQLNFCVVEKEAGVLVVKRTVEDGDIWIDEVPFTFVLNEEEVREMEIEEGDIIDLAYYKGNPQNHKIIWKYIDIKQDEIVTKKNDTGSIRKSKKMKTEKEEKDIPLSLKDKKVLVIGNEPKKALYQSSIEERGGIFLWADAKDDFNYLESVVRKSDIVIFLLKVSGHVGMKQIKALCKQYGVPFLTTFSNGKTSLIKMAEEMVG